MHRTQFSQVILGILVTAALILGSGVATQAQYKVLHKFTGGADGANPEDALTFDAAGNLYGTTRSTVFELSPNPDGTWTETVLYDFTGANDPSDIRASVIFDANGNLYGTSHAGGDYGAGTVYELMPSSGGTWSENILHSFTGGSDGYGPVGGLIFDAVGNLYGAARGGGAYGHGVVYELTPNLDGSWTETVLHNFANGADGAYPDHSNLTFDSTGNLYGVTADGGVQTCFWLDSGCGVVFKLTPNGDGTWTESVLYSFTGGKDGSIPQSTLVFDAEGNLYGTTMQAGAYGYGVVFELTLGADGIWTEQVLHQFNGGTDGASPWSGVAFDAAGNLYGATHDGGGGSCGGGCGTVFELLPNPQGRWAERILHRFKSTPNDAPIGKVVLDNAGNLYGTTSGESTSGYGGVYEISSSFTVCLSPNSATLTAGQSTNSTLTLTPLVDFTGTVNLTCTVPSGDGLSCGVSPGSVTLNGTGTATATLTIDTSSTTPSGTYQIQAQGTSGTLVRTATFALTVQ